MTTDANGQVLQRYDYTPFGEPWPSQPTPETRRFGGGELDAETQLNYFGARMYLSQTGRFTRADDPGYGNPFDPQSMNLYACVSNNPLRWVDPTRHQITCPEDVPPPQLPHCSQDGGEIRGTMPDPLQP
jgi:RHS repeat-associated protein